MPRKKKSEKEKVVSLGASVPPHIKAEVARIAAKDPYETEDREPRSKSTTGAFLVRVGLRLYHREKKPLYQLLNELEGADVATDLNHPDGEGVLGTAGNLPNRAPEASRARPHPVREGIARRSR